jgi:UDP-N-acetylmuramate dehydrogenase
LILESVSAGLSGLEALYGIPGSVGGAVIVNCGAHGITISDFIRSATVMISSDKIISCPPSWFKFGYRQSKLKYSKSDSPPVILSVTLQLQHRKREDSAALVAKYQKWREAHQPLGQITSGSIFRNPKGSDVTASEDDKYKSAGYLLDSVGAKGFRVGGAVVSKKHANWIINSGNASASDIRSLVEKMRGAVESKYHVTLVEEIEYLGDWG